MVLHVSIETMSCFISHRIFLFSTISALFSSLSSKSCLVLRWGRNSAGLPGEWAGLGAYWPLATLLKSRDLILSCGSICADDISDQLFNLGTLVLYLNYFIFAFNSKVVITDDRYHVIAVEVHVTWLRDLNVLYHFWYGQNLGACLST